MVTLVLLGLVGGLIAGVSPCILPVVPVLFLSGGASAARATTGETSVSVSGPVPVPGSAAPGRAASSRPSRPSRPSRRPYLIVAGLALSFSVFTLLGTLVLNALPVPKDTLRWAGLVALVLLGLAMMVPRVGEILERPFARLPTRPVGAGHGGFALGLALGAVYVPCAGPVLAAITVAGATGRIGLGTVALTVAFAVGTAAPLLAFALAGRGVAERVRAFRERQRGVNVLAGAVVIALAVALTFNVTDALQRAVPGYTSALDSSLGGDSVARHLGVSRSAALAACAAVTVTVPVDCGAAPPIAGIQRWLNTPGAAPLSLESLRGKVVLVDFWAYSCINCQRAISHVAAWYSAYRDDGFVVIGVHTPEYAFEHVPGNVASGARRLGITYPIALDNDYTTWNNYGNNSWPADYLIDSTGEIRHVTVGEGDYPTTESLIRRLLTAADPAVRLPRATRVADGTPTSQQTPETYLGAERADGYGGPTPLEAGTHAFAYPAMVPDNAFGLTGTWTVGNQSITSGGGAGIRLNFLAEDIYLDVGGTGTMTATVDGRTTTYHVGGAPNIYTLLRRDNSTHGVLEVTLSPGLDAYSFTFG